jgi:hypothetical protein
MRFLRSGGPAAHPRDDISSSQNNDQFFITENIVDSHPMMGDSKIIQEERSQQESEFDDPNNDDGESSPQNDEDKDEMDANFDFGRAKMDYFKQRAKDILMSDADLEYDGNAMQMAMCFKNLKNAIRNPVVVHAGMENQPHYWKMTFSTARAAVNGDRFLEMSKLIGSNGSLKPEAVSSSKFGGSQSISKIPALMRAGKEMQEESLIMLSGLLGTTMKKKTKKEEMIDKKIEYLLETYKK